MSFRKLTKQEVEAAQKGTIVSFVKGLFEENPEISTTDCIEAVAQVFPQSKFQKSHVAFYRNKFRKAGMDIPFIRQPKEDEEEPAPAPVVKKNKKVAKA